MADEGRPDLGPGAWGPPREDLALRVMAATLYDMLWRLSSPDMCPTADEISTLLARCGWRCGDPAGVGGQLGDVMMYALAQLPAASRKQLIKRVEAVHWLLTEHEKGNT